MKSTYQFSIIMVIALLSFSITSCESQPNMAGEKTITLYVDTDNVNQNNLDTTCNFGQINGSNQDFLTEVNFEDKIIWKGVSTSNDNAIVKIKKIRYVSGAEVLTKRELRNSFLSRKVKGNVKKPVDIDPGAIEKYSIEFKVSGINERFIIDPKLQVLR